MRKGTEILLYPINVNGLGRPLHFVSQVQASTYLGKSRFCIHEHVSRKWNFISSGKRDYYIMHGQGVEQMNREVKEFIVKREEREQTYIGGYRIITPEQKERREAKFKKLLKMVRDLEDKYDYCDGIPNWINCVNARELQDLRKCARQC